MFKFIVSEELDENVDNEYIDKIENEWKIKFPAILREYYLKHNGAEMKETSFFMHNIEFNVEFIVPLKYGNVNVESRLELYKDEEYFPKTFVTLAKDTDGDYYFWDSNDGKVYYLAVGNVENPIPIARSVEEFFEILNKSCTEEITTTKIDLNIPKNENIQTKICENMFKFIISEELDENVDNEYIDKIENEWKIKFPAILREYYLKHNGAEMRECAFKKVGIEDNFVVEFIIPLKYAKINVEYLLNLYKDDKYIPKSFVPLAEDVDGDDYFWDSNDGKVYYLAMGNVENPVPIASSVEEFFEILNKSCDGEIPITNFNNALKEKNDSLQFASQNSNDSSKIQSILKYNGKFVLACFLTCLVINIILFIFFLISDELLVLFLIFIIGFYALIFLIIDLINRIKSKNALKKHDINILKKELETAIKLEGIDTYLTDNYIISNSKTIKITKYSEIKWAFIDKASGTVSQRAIVSSAYRLGGTPVIAYLNNGKKVVVALIKNENNANMLFTKIRNENNDVLIGNTLENTNKYKATNPNYKKLDSDKIAYIIVILILVGAMIYGIFNR